MAEIVVQAPDGSERTVPLLDRPLTIGRSEDCDVVLEEAKASRRHCTIRQAPGGWRVVDEGSSNGTWLGGKCVLSARLQNGDDIEIGETVLTFEEGSVERKAADAARRRAARRTPMPWGALLTSVALAVAAWFGAGALCDAQYAHEIASWKRFAVAEVALAERLDDEDAWRSRLGALEAELFGRPSSGDALTVLREARTRGFPKPEPAAESPEWRKKLDALDGTRARMTAAERRTRLRELLSRNLSDSAAVAAVADALRKDEAAAAERDGAAATQNLLDAARAYEEGQWAKALEAWAAWSAAQPSVSRDDERAIAARMAETRAKAKAEAESVFAAWTAQVEEGRVSAATSLVDAALPRLRGTGWDAWLSGRTKRTAEDAAGPRGPTASGGAPKVDTKALARERMLSVLRSSEDFVRRRRFADAGVMARDGAAAIDDPAIREELETRAADLAAEAEILEVVLSQVRADAKPFGVVRGEKGNVRVAGANADALLLDDGKSGEGRWVPVADAPGPTLAGLLEKAKLEPAQWIAAALLCQDLREEESYTAWMRKALADASLQPVASPVHARVRSEALPVGGYVPHPRDTKSIVPYDVGRRIQNEEKIAAFTGDLAKTVEKIDASKQSKSIERVAEAYAKLEAARNHALELIFDEKKYFYPYRGREREYAPVQREVNDRVEAVRAVWEEKVSAKVKSDTGLDKLLQHAKDVLLEIEYLGGTAPELRARVERIESYLGKELTVQTFFETPDDLRLLEYNDQMLATNAKLKGGVDEPEREQVRITNEYRRMFGHRRMLRLHEKLVLAARGHSNDMSTIGFFDHMSPVEGKKTPWDRMTLAGYPNSPCSENIAAGIGDPQSAHNGWVHSSGHHRNLLMRDWSEMGTGCSGGYWTQNFGYAATDSDVGGPGPGASPQEPR